MSIKHEPRKLKRSPEEQARIDAIREKYLREKPGPDQLAASGDYEGPVQAGAYWEVCRLMAELKAERERQGLTLAQLAKRAGIDKGAISKLETGRQVNPTFDTLSRIAAGLGVRLGLMLQPEGERDGRQAVHDARTPCNNQQTGSSRCRSFTEMANAADTGEKSSVRALQAWQYLIAKASNRQIVKYDELRELMGYADNRPLSSILGCIAFFCILNKLPPLTLIVVNQSGIPGEGFPGDQMANWHQLREEVFNHPWYGMVPPTLKEFRDAYTTGKHG